jgi:CPA2 family monovalent cation:H+ antiporter-2
MQMAANTLIYSILTVAVIFLMFSFAEPVVSRMLPDSAFRWTANALTGLLTVLLIAPFLRAMIMKKNRSEEFKALWAESNINRLPLIFTILVRVVIAVAFIFYICNHLTRFTPAVMITLGLIVVVFIVISRRIKNNSIRLERLFINNLRSRDIEAQVSGKKRPLYEGRLLDRDVHIAEFNIPMNTRWMGHTLRQLAFGSKYGVHVSSILRANHRLNIPDGDYLIFPGDKIQVIGSDQQLAAFGQAVSSEVFGEDLNFEQREMKLRQYVVKDNSPFIDKTLEQSGIRSLYSCMVVGLEEGKENLSPVKPTRKFQAGDIIWVVGEQEALDTLFAV